MLLTRLTMADQQGSERFKFVIYNAISRKRHTVFLIPFIDPKQAIQRQLGLREPFLLTWNWEINSVNWNDTLHELQQANGELMFHIEQPQIGPQRFRSTADLNKPLPPVPQCEPLA